MAVVLRVMVRQKMTFFRSALCRHYMAAAAAARVVAWVLVLGSFRIAGR